MATIAESRPDGNYTHGAMTAHLPPDNVSPRDEIFLQGMRFYGYHGVNPEERVLGQRFSVDVAVAVDLRPAGESDDLGDTVSYSAIYKIVRGIVEGPPRNLLEAVAEEIARELLTAYSPLTRVTVTVGKPEAPLKGATFDAAGVRITRWRNEKDEQT